jgi:hypothetical protein
MKKKSVKKTTKKITEKVKPEQKSGRIYGVIGMLALFLLGLMFGFIINGSDRLNHSTMSKADCRDIADEIMEAAKNRRPDLIEQLNKVYSENCLDREFEKPKPKIVEHVKLSNTTCEAIEELLKHDLWDENDRNWDVHENNANVYQKLADKGCEENRDKYLQLSQREREIANALKETPDNISEPGLTCRQIEALLSQRLYPVHNPDARAHIENAQIYANLSERGCQDNLQKYKELAKQEIDIARALTDDNVDKYRNESVEMVETYKRLQMQKEAERMIEKAKKLTNPAIDFIIQLEKIIEE